MSGDLGTESGQATLNITSKAVGKSIEGICRLLLKLLTYISKRDEREKLKQELALLKSKAERQAALDEVAGKIGEIEFVKMKKSGLPFVNMQTNFSEEDMKRFSELASRHGLNFSGINIGSKEHPEKQLVVFVKDLQIVNQIVEQMRKEKMIDECQNRIDAIINERGGVENLTEQDKIDIEALQKEQDKIRGEMMEEINQATKNSSINAVLDENGNFKVFTMEEAINRNDGYKAERDFIIADAENPNNFIKVHSFGDEWVRGGKAIPYTHSIYEVYKSGECVKEFDDKRYVGRPKGTWQDMREEMKSLMENPTKIYEFRDIESYKIWMQETIRQNETKLTNNTIESLSKELQSKGFEFDSTTGKVQLANDVLYKNDKETIKIPKGTIVSKEFVKELQSEKVSKAYPMEVKLNLSEAFIVGERIHLMNELGDLKIELGNAKAELIMAETNNEKTVADGRIKDVENKISKKEEELKGNTKQREQINAAQAKEMQEKEGIKENTKEKDGAKAMDGGEREDTRRDERVDQEGEKQMNMEEVKEEIAKERSRENDVQDHSREGERLSAEKIKVESPAHDER